MDQNLSTFFSGFRQEILAGAEANQSFQLSEFLNVLTDELTDTGFIDGYEHCHYRAQRGMRVDGYWFDDDGNLDLFVADFESRERPVSLTKSEVDAIFNRVVSFYQASKEKALYKDLEETTPEYGLARQISDRGDSIKRLGFYLISERVLSERLQSLDENTVTGIAANYHIWDLSRLQRQRSSKGHKEALNIDFCKEFGSGIPCLPAHLGATHYQSYLIVMPAKVLASLYDKYGSRLLEQNVRCFLQARSKVNKGIRNTILNEPQMFFAYNNGITATAQEIKTRNTENGLELTETRDLQIVNGGQTTASLFHTNRSDRTPLDGVFVQMKLSIVDGELNEEIVPKISEYANTQNRVNAADFFSNHPFHIRMEEFSRRIWAPAQGTDQRETKWFYERARGQYADAQVKLTPSKRKRFQAEFPSKKKYTKTDLAKFENVWDENPRFVNLGAQKNFAQYAKRIGAEWKKNPDNFNELYFKKTIARAILFRSTEKIVSSQPWYNGGYRANVVAYTLALLGHYCTKNDKSMDFVKIWSQQALPTEIETAIECTAELVHSDIIKPPDGISNVSEWCKREGCWQRLKEKVSVLDELLTRSYKAGLIEKDQEAEELRSARKDQKIYNGIEAQVKVVSISSHEWNRISELCRQRGILTEKENNVLDIAKLIPDRIPSEKQSEILVGVLQKAELEGIKFAGGGN